MIIVFCFRHLMNVSKEVIQIAGLKNSGFKSHSSAAMLLNAGKCGYVLDLQFYSMWPTWLISSTQSLLHVATTSIATPPGLVPQVHLRVIAPHPPPPNISHHYPFMLFQGRGNKFQDKKRHNNIVLQ